MQNGQADRCGTVVYDTASGQLQNALQNLELASALISVMLNDELVACSHPAKLDQLYSAKGAVTCAIEAARKHLPDKH